jgi:hypothetical protein
MKLSTELKVKLIAAVLLVGVFSVTSTMGSHQSGETSVKDVRSLQ